MPKSAKSQWDFGELFPPEQIRRVLTVAELTRQVRGLLETQIGNIWVTGEITNFRAQSSGHIYFTLKDADSQLNCVLFRTEARDTRDLLEDGRKVILRGDLTVYEPRGQYQLRVTAVELQGLGALQAAFEKLKQKLNAEGLFAAERKRPLPPYPRRIGLVTSPTGAAIRDILHVVRRRNPGLEIVLAPCRVQGDGAGTEIASAIRLLNDFVTHHSHDDDKLDLILLTRGGGSLEDLWAFNEESVARAIFESAIPVVSAVGHEIDFTISDFVADVRAATPSAAAEIITEDVFSSIEFIEGAAGRLRQLLLLGFADRREELLATAARLQRFHPRRRLNDFSQRLDDLQITLQRCTRKALRDGRTALANLRQHLLRARPRLALSRRRDLVDHQAARLRELLARQLDHRRHALKRADAHLRLLGPNQVLARGYSITTRAEDGKILRAAGDVKAGEQLRTRLKSGELRSVVSEARNENPKPSAK